MTTDTKAVARYIPTSSHGGMVRVEGSGDGTYVSDSDHERVVGELRKDAERYRWLRNPDADVGLVIDKVTGEIPYDEGTGTGGYHTYEYRAGEELDTAIDAAMEKGNV